MSEVFMDAGISGKRADNRPELQKALTAVTKAKGVLVVYSLSRLARSTRDTIQISEKLSKAGADLVSVSEKIDTTSAAGKMVFQMLAVLAEFERNQTSERTKMALQYKKTQGKRIGQLPFGFSLAEDGESLVPVVREQCIIELMMLLRESGLSFSKIAGILNKKRVPTKEANGQWRSSTVLRIVGRQTA
jgi:DNA invertase Pin-like site-specific DNA recombinase